VDLCTFGKFIRRPLLASQYSRHESQCQCAILHEYFAWTLDHYRWLNADGDGYNVVVFEDVFMYAGFST